MMASDLEESVDCELIETEKDWITSVLEKYRLSYTRGFIPDEDPLLEFTNLYFSPWDEIFKDLTHLIQCRKLREAVENMPLLDHTKLNNEQERDRAFLVLSAIGNGYVWQNGEHNPVKVIPKCLAVPWVAVAEHTGACPVIGHWSIVLNNWKIKDKAKPLDINNIDTQFVFTGSKDEFWFYAVTWQLEMHAVPAIKSVVAAQKAVTDDNLKLLQACLVTIRRTIEQLKSTLRRMFEHCDPEFFYTKLRIFLAGWKNYKTFPEGMLYEGVTSKPLQFSGGSAAQSTTFQIFDAVLGVVHPKIEDGQKAFLESMLDYMPRWHREFVLYVRNGPSVRDYVQKSSNENLKKLYNDCVESLVEFRSFHIQIVTSVTILLRNYITFRSFPESILVRLERNLERVQNAKDISQFKQQKANIVVSRCWPDKEREAQELCHFSKEYDKKLPISKFTPKIDGQTTLHDALGIKRC